MRFGTLEIDRNARTVLGGRHALADLTSYQFDLLVAMAERAGRVLTRDQIMEAVRGRELEAFDRSIDVHMGRIRAAIEADAKNPKRILTVRGVGYVFAETARLSSCRCCAASTTPPLRPHLARGGGRRRHPHADGQLDRARAAEAERDAPGAGAAQRGRAGRTGQADRRGQPGPCA